MEESNNNTQILCNKCGSEVQSNMNFCPQCGTVTEIKTTFFCPVCNTEITDSNMKFCYNCGKEITPAMKQTQAAALAQAAYLNNREAACDTKSVIFCKNKNFKIISLLCAVIVILLIAIIVMCNKSSAQANDKAQITKTKKQKTAELAKNDKSTTTATLNAEQKTEKKDIVNAEKQSKSSSAASAPTWEAELQAAKAAGIIFSHDNKTLLKCPTTVTSVVIPSCVTTIGKGAFRACRNLKQIEFPSSVKIIGDEAFLQCGIREINIPGTVDSIGYLAFFNPGLTKVNIGEGVKHIGSKSLLGPVDSITIPGSVTFIGDGAFSRVKSVKVANNNKIFKVDQYGALLDTERKRILYIPPEFEGEYTIPDGITSIGTWAFIDRKKLTGITIPNGVEYIGEFAFARCNLNKVFIPGSVKTIDIGAFSSSPNLSRVTFRNNSEAVIKSRAFEDCKKLNRVSIPDNVKVMPNAFPHNCRVVKR